jgi:CoA:oxalate CoA-transferase
MNSRQEGVPPGVPRQGRKVYFLVLQPAKADCWSEALSCREFIRWQNRRSRSFVGYHKTMTTQPLQGLLVLDFSIFLSAPSCSLRLADLGARVIKVERPDGGDLCRQLYISNLELDGDSTLFHSINRNKQSFSANLKDPADRAKIEKLILRADVLLQNFRPGVMERLGLDYETVRKINPRLIYGTVTGYGTTGPWRDKPGQDLLAQSLSGVAWLSGDATQGPVPMGLSIADMLAGAHLCQGVLACLVRRGITGEGGLVEVSLLESLLDFQFEVFTTHLNDGGQEPQRSAVNNAHAYLGAPYGIYRTQDGYLALAMGSVTRLGELLDCGHMAEFSDPKSWFTRRDEIKEISGASQNPFDTALARHSGTRRYLVCRRADMDASA